jgi:hypothetical protein
VNNRQGVLPSQSSVSVEEGPPSPVSPIDRSVVISHPVRAINQQAESYSASQLQDSVSRLHSVGSLEAQPSVMVSAVQADLAVSLSPPVVSVASHAVTHLSPSRVLESAALPAPVPIASFLSAAIPIEIGTPESPPPFSVPLPLVRNPLSSSGKRRSRRRPTGSASSAAVGNVRDKSQNWRDRQSIHPDKPRAILGGLWTIVSQCPTFSR